MLFDVWVSENPFFDATSTMTFHFGDDINEAKRFAEMILQTSNYFVAIIPALNEEEVE